MNAANNPPPGRPNDKTVIRRRVPPPDEALDKTQITRRPPPTVRSWRGEPPPPPPPPPGGPPGGGQGGPPGGPPRPPKRRGGLGGLRRDQVRYLIVAWFGFTLIAGVCAFAAIYAVTTGDGFRSTDATPIGQVPTITPVPTIDPGTVIPTLLPSEEPQGAPTQPPDSGGGPQLPPIEAFNLGGQSIHGGFPGAESMRQAGMTWVKLQAFDLTIDFGPAIENAHNMGFRILITVVDKANKDLVTSPDYQQTYADYLVTVAQQGADAIEVWNEENIDREWPSGQIGGAAYASLLEFVYPQIKAANGQTIVISGAPSPTGFFGGACGPAGCDDKPFLKDMVNAGALNYVDCVGIHYNEGILSPTQTSGDPRGNSNHYTRYYQTMVDTYLEATGDLKPLCFTELGYLTDEGYDDLGVVAPSFSWASSTTVAQQAQWLGEAVTRAKASDGKILLLVVFNVDFVEYGADPQAGYAIIRPDGSCPACETLAGVMRD